MRTIRRRAMHRDNHGLPGLARNCVKGAAAHRRRNFLTEGYLDSECQLQPLPQCIPNGHALRHSLLTPVE